MELASFIHLLALLSLSGSATDSRGCPLAAELPYSFHRIVSGVTMCSYNVQIVHLICQKPGDPLVDLSGEEKCASSRWTILKLLEVLVFVFITRARSLSELACSFRWFIVDQTGVKI